MIYFYKGNNNQIKQKEDVIDDDENLKIIKTEILKVLDSKNLSILMGSGCSSLVLEMDEEKPDNLTQENHDVNSAEEKPDNVTQENHDVNSAEEKPDDNSVEANLNTNVSEATLDSNTSEATPDKNSLEINYVKEQTLGNATNKIFKEVGIPTMAPMARGFYEANKDKLVWLRDFGLDTDKIAEEKDLEKFLSVLFNLEYYFDKIDVCDEDNELSSFIGNKKYSLDALKNSLKDTIELTRNFIIKKVLNKENDDLRVVELYIQFYRALMSRNATLPKINIITTNYDLYNERALDSIGIQYANGFSGGIERYFNPTIFNYALAEKMDISQSKWQVIDNFVYLYKIHGSINWIQREARNKMFDVKEIQDPTFEILEREKAIMIYPTPLKYSASLSTPYIDLFREFQRKLMQNNNILITIGYSFSDTHINNLIYQAFTIPTFRLIVFGSDSLPSIKKLLDLNDPRIWIIGGALESKEMLHYFKNIIDLFPTTEDLMSQTLVQTINTLKPLVNE